MCCVSVGLLVNLSQKVKQPCFEIHNRVFFKVSDKGCPRSLFDGWLPVPATI